MGQDEKQAAGGQPKRKRLRRWLRWPRITLDLSQKRHRRRLAFGLFTIVFMSLVFVFSSVKGYEYTESAEFCGTACHPMDPEFVRYEHSAHSEVECVECHIGPGTSFFVKSKIDGVRQVYAVLASTYSRPIKSPVHDLRPAQDTCENCHSPRLFRDNIIKTIQHYDNDEENTPIRSTLILKMGGWNGRTGIGQGIHWHITSPVYYIAADEERQVVMWIGVEQEDGSLKEYFSRDMLVMADSSFVEEAWENGEVRQVDCIDCHNRAAHDIPPPDRLIDTAIEDGLINVEIPFIRAKAVEVLTPEYASEEEAFQAIEGLVSFYEVGYPEWAGERLLELMESIAYIKELYQETNFPEMGVNWETNPNNQRHTPTLGCFRCHDDKHVVFDRQGQEVETLSVKCNLCHTVPIVGRGEEMLVEAPVIVGTVPESHSDFSWTITHRDVDRAEQRECYQCHGQGFCNNGACHNLSHPPDMLFSHAEEYQKQGDQVCYTCHQNILCSRCHPGGILDSP